MPRQKTMSDEAVLDATLEVMRVQGLRDFTLADVGQAVDLAPATLLQRFGGKRALIVRALAHDNNQFATRLAQLPDNIGPAAVIAVFALLTQNSASPPPIPAERLWLSLDLSDHELNTLARRRQETLHAAVVVRMPVLPIEPDDAARLIEAQWLGALIQWSVASERSLIAYVTAALADWFALVTRR